MAKALAFLVLLLVSPTAYAATHTVGSSGGWNTGVNYDSWARGETFAVGDTLVFNFDPSHAVDEVTQANYQSCGTANPISSSSNSPTTITLSAPGTRYFICPRSNHCSQGMKLQVTVAQGSTSPSGSPTTPGSPATPTGGSPGQVASPPPPPGGSSASSLMAGSSLVLAGLVLGVIMG